MKYILLGLLSLCSGSRAADILQSEHLSALEIVDRYQHDPLIQGPFVQIMGAIRVPMNASIEGKLALDFHAKEQRATLAAYLHIVTEKFPIKRHNPEKSEIKVCEHYFFLPLRLAPVVEIGAPLYAKQYMEWKCVVDELKEELKILSQQDAQRIMYEMCSNQDVKHIKS